MNVPIHGKPSLLVTTLIEHNALVIHNFHAINEFLEMIQPFWNKPAVSCTCQNSIVSKRKVKICINDMVFLGSKKPCDIKRRPGGRIIMDMKVDTRECMLFSDVSGKVVE